MTESRVRAETALQAPTAPPRDTARGLDITAGVSRHLSWPWIVASLIAVAALPLLLSQLASGALLTELVMTFFVMAIVAQCWNLVLGVSGIFSLAQVALYGVGGYAGALLAIYAGFNPWIALLFGPVGAVIASLIIGLPVLRLRGIYVALLTLAFHELMRNYLVTGPEVLGRGFGLRVSTLFTGPNALLPTYYVGMALFFISSYAVWRIIYSPIGMAFTALRDSEAYATSRGINTFRLRLALFAYSAFFTGLAGSYAVFWQGVVTPAVLDFNLLITLVAMIVLGGWATFAGPIVGAAVFIMLDEWLLKPLGAGFSEVALGTLVVLIVVIAPRGLVPTLRGQVQRYRDVYRALA